ncbi:hypothetical protein ACFFGV_08125 [Pontibacillus salicampi]|uniref:Multi-TM2 domain-containing protein n=1 Tax=Pontibacillus salicampi TaxID=1449801 RepID=A0ABV6LMB1_9BACI
MNNKSSVLALLLSLIPGLGHMYLHKRIKGFVYGLLFFGPLTLAFMIAIANYMYEEVILILLAISFGVFIITMVDMIVTLLILEREQRAGFINEEGHKTKDNERFFTILLSFVPGVGHFHLGLNQRGLTLVTAFIGLAIMVVFITFLTSTSGFIIFLLALPVIWIYSLFDVIQLMNQRARGEMLEDRTILEDFDRHRQADKKSKVLATILGFFPGAGHMYLGLQRRGLQLMIGFLLSIYVLDTLRLSFFLFLIPVIWFYSFFDALQHAAKAEDEVLEDIPLVKQFLNHQRWFGIALITIGSFFILDRILVPILDDQLSQIMNINVRFYYSEYFQLIIVSFLFIWGGIKLLAGTKEASSKRKEEDLL